MQLRKVQLELGIMAGVGGLALPPGLLAESLAESQLVTKTLLLR